MPQGLLIAAERSGAGKTMITAALARALIDRGLVVQCFKVGPDFIDPGYHAAVTGRVSRNLDGWMMGRDCCLQTFHRAMEGADIGVVEGVMGLFDGLSGGGDEGSSVQIAKWLGLPVILIIDGSSFSRSAGAVALGFEQFDPGVHIAGIIFNKVGSPAHYEMLKAGVQEKCRADVLGYIPRDVQWQTPERHLGLVMAAERTALQETLGQLAQQIAQTVNVDKIIQYAISGQTHRSAPTVYSAHSLPPDPRTLIPKIGVARDEAFCFCYQDNLDMLKQFGAELVFFSPLQDTAMPESIQGLYLPGGYPELHAETLSKNTTMRMAIAAFCAAGRPVYAECGGFLYLLESLTGLDGNSHAMAGFFPSQARMLPRLQRLGYVEAAALPGHPYLAEGEKIRGHEFHYSAISGMPARIQRTYRVMRRKDKAEFDEGFRLHNTLAGYMHLHFASNPGFAEHFVGSCRQAPPS
ncbi:MAG: cobyrinate a,c-diamide synthase [Deltaproteobacteria bacterium]|nr:cobyrinate a,c-diamide synthase [Deltaproteobacteria bacterium]